MTETPADFLAAQYDEDEKTAAGLRAMVRSLSEINDRRSPATRNGTQVYDAGAWALDRLLADIAAKRQLLALWQRMEADLDSPGFHQAADELLAQLLAPYGKRAVFTREGSSGPLSWHLEDDPGHIEA